MLIKAACSALAAREEGARDRMTIEAAEAFEAFGGLVRSATFKDASFADTTNVSGILGTAFPPACWKQSFGSSHCIRHVGAGQSSRGLHFHSHSGSAHFDWHSPDGQVVKQFVGGEQIVLHVGHSPISQCCCGHTTAQCG